MKGATDDGMIARYGYNVKVSTRAPVKGATDTPRHDRIAVVMVSTRAPVKGATFLRRGLGDLTQVSTRAPVKGATAIIKTAVFSRRYIN